MTISDAYEPAAVVASAEAPEQDFALTKGQVRYSMFTSFLAWVFSVYDYTLFGLLLPVIAVSFGWSTDYSLVVNTWVSVGVAVISFTVGPIVDRFGRTNAMMFTTAGAAVSSGLTGFTGGALSLGIVRAFSGFGVSEQAVNATYLAEVLPPKKRGFMYSFVQCGWPVGALLGTGLVAALLPLVGWRGLFFIATFPAIVITILRLRLKESPRFEQMKRVRELRKTGRLEEANQLAARYGIDHSQMDKLTFVQLFEPGRRKQTISLMATQLLNWFGIIVFSVLATTVLVEGKHIDFLNSLPMLLISNVAGVLGYLVLGWIGDRLGRRETVSGAYVLCGLSFISLLYLANGTVAIVVCYSLGLFFMNGLASPLFSYFSESYPTRMRGTAVAFINALGPLGAILSAAVLAGLTAVFGITFAAFLAGAVPILLAAVTILGGARVKPGTELESISR